MGQLEQWEGKAIGIVEHCVGDAGQWGGHHRYYHCCLVTVVPLFLSMSFFMALRVKAREAAAVRSRVREPRPGESA